MTSWLYIPLSTLFCLGLGHASARRDPFIRPFPRTPSPDAPRVGNRRRSAPSASGIEAQIRCCSNEYTAGRSFTQPAGRRNNTYFRRSDLLEIRCNSALTAKTRLADEGCDRMVRLASNRLFRFHTKSFHTKRNPFGKTPHPFR